jgi:hypothetical protein
LFGRVVRGEIVSKQNKNDERSLAELPEMGATVEEEEEGDAGIPRNDRSSVVHVLVASLPFLLLLVLLAGALLALYARSLDDILVADDLGLVVKLIDASFGKVFAITPNWQHYLPVQQLVLYVLANSVEADPLAYHATALVFGWISATLVVVLTRQLTGRFTVSVFAGMLFVAFGTNWEPYLRAAAGTAYTAATALALAGMSLYILANNQRFSRRGRQFAYGGFLVTLILAPFAYGQGITLIGACVLYRLLVLERGVGFSPGELAQRARNWLRDFLLPALLVLGWFGFKASLGISRQAPGLDSSWQSQLENLGIGLPRMFLPGGGTSIVESAWAATNPLMVLIVGLCIIAVLVWRGTPVVRFLALWAMLAIITVVVGIGESSVLSSRHLYMGTAVASILWAILIWSLIRPTTVALAQLGVRADLSRVLRLVPTVAVAVVFLVAGGHYAAERQADWDSATNRADKILTQIERLSQSHPAATRLYLLDLPVADRTPFGEPIPIFPPYSTDSQVELRMSDRFSEVTPVMSAFPGKRLPPETVALENVEQEIQQPEALALAYEQNKGKGGEMSVWEAPSDPAQLTGVDDRADAMITVVAGKILKQQQEPITVSRTGLISVTGWAAYADSRAGEVLVTIDDQRDIRATYPLNRLPRKPPSLDATDARPWRFVAKIPADEIGGAGEHTLSLKVLASDQESYQETDEVEIEVVANGT